MTFIMNNIEIIILAIVGVAGFFLIGKKKSVTLAKEVIYELRDEIGDNIIANQDKYTNLVYAKLPLKSRVFITKAMVKKAIVEIGYLIDVNEVRDLDKK